MPERHDFQPRELRLPMVIVYSVFLSFHVLFVLHNYSLSTWHLISTAMIFIPVFFLSHSFYRWADVACEKNPQFYYLNANIGVVPIKLEADHE